MWFTARGIAVRDVLENLAQHYPHRRDGWVNVGVLHTGIQGIAGHARYAPCTVDDLTACEYEYFALGHIHERGEQAEGDTPVWFSGNLQGRHPREAGPKGALVVDVEPNGPAQVRFAECDVARWDVLKPDLAECKDVEDVVDAMASEYQTALGQAGDRPLVVRFHLLGQTPAAGALAAAGPERVLAEARSLSSGRQRGRQGGCRRLAAGLVPDPRPRAGRAGHRRHSSSGSKSRHGSRILEDLRKFGLWRLTRDTEIDLDVDETLASLVQRAGRRLTANLGA